MYEIIIKNMTVFAHHGVLKEEKANGQPFIFDILIKVNSSSDLNDDIENTLNYAQIFEFIKNYSTENTFNLIETLGQKLCNEILLNFENALYIRIEVKKPNAPMNGDFEYVGVCIEQERNIVYLSLGSNLGDKYKNLTVAIDKINTARVTKVLSVSNFYTTSPVGYENQDDFLNCCVKIHTLLSPFELLNNLKNIEHEMLREKTVRFGPRTIDVDILLYNDEIINSPELTIPHEQMLNRKFVIVPLLEIYDGDILKLWEFKNALNTLSENSDKIELFK